jgi:hypothetical protein
MKLNPVSHSIHFSHKLSNKIEAFKEGLSKKIERKNSQTFEDE